MTTATETGYVPIETIMNIDGVLLNRRDFDVYKVTTAWDGREAISATDARVAVADGRARYDLDQRIRLAWSQYPDDRTARRNAAYQRAAERVDVRGLHGSQALILQFEAGQQAIAQFDAGEPYPTDMFAWAKATGLMR